MADKGIGLADILVRQLTKAKSSAANIAKDSSPLPLANNFHTLNAVKSTSTLNAAKVESNQGAGNTAKSSKIKAYQEAAAQAPNIPLARDATLEAVLNTALDRSDDVEDADQTMFSVNAQLNEIAQPWIKDAVGKLDQASGELKGNISDAIKNQILPIGMGLVNKVTTAASVVAKNIASGSFVNRMATHAQKASQETGLPADFMMGQAALETGWGKREINGLDGLPSNNLFGIKANASWTGKVVTVQTSEYINGIKQPKIEKFRAYDSYAESFKDFANMIKNSPRYQNVMNNLQSATDYAQALQSAGYATDPQYALKLAGTIKQIQP
ncbi:flagellar assembly peptidoglycan hydrolase FlgJ [Polynucleobacter sp. MWH-Mekk-B1]|nr:flagellar assembly peptidoglycan hydrolase FlgJ [Polynucleobacter finlandensis]